MIVRYKCFSSELAVDIDIGLLSFSRVSESDEFVSETIALGALWISPRRSLKINAKNFLSMKILFDEGESR